MTKRKSFVIVLARDPRGSVYLGKQLDAVRDITRARTFRSRALAASIVLHAYPMAATEVYRDCVQPDCHERATHRLVKLKQGWEAKPSASPLLCAAHACHRTTTGGAQ